MIFELIVLCLHCDAKQEQRDINNNHDQVLRSGRIQIERVTIEFITFPIIINYYWPQMHTILHCLQ